MPWTVADVDKHKKGLTDRQKKQWVRIANSALAACVARGGRRQACEASAIRQANGTVGTSSEGDMKKGTITVRGGEERYLVHVNNYPLRTEMHQGQTHTVVPVVMMVEGVHRGSHGPILHLAEELSKFVAAWNGIPITIDHPIEEGEEGEDGIPVSANKPEIIDEQTVGRIFNARCEGGKLKAEAWIDDSKISRLSSKAFNHITQGRPLDVSVGVFSNDEEKSGTWRGERYIAIARDYRPDHLALLPGGVGACSWDDGCGVRANEKKGGDISVKEVWEVAKDLNSKGFSVVQINQEGFSEIMSAIRSKLDQMDNQVKVFFLQEVFEDYFIYQVQSREESSTPQALFKRKYTVSEDSGVEFVGDPVPVTRKVEYVEKKVESFSEGGKRGMADDEKKVLETHKEPDCVEKVEAMMERKEKEKEEKKQAEQKEEKLVKANKEAEELKGSLADPDKAKEVLTGEAKELLELGVKIHTEKKGALIKTITANSKAWSEEELSFKSLEELEKLSSLVPEKIANYSGQGGGGALKPAAEAEVLLPAGVKEA